MKRDIAKHKYEKKRRQFPEIFSYLRFSATYIITNRDMKKKNKGT